MFERVKDVNHPDEDLLSVYRDHGVVRREGRGDNFNKAALDRSIYQLVHPGWLVVNRMKAWQGSVGISPFRGIVSGHYICFRPTHHEHDRFLNWLFRSGPYTAEYASLSRGVRPNQVEIDNEWLRSLRIALPPLEEQRRIADFLDAETARIDRLLRLCERLGRLARERSQRVLDETIGQCKDLVPLRYIVRFREGPGIMAADFHPFGVPLVRIAGLQRGEVTLNGCNFLDPDKVARQWSHFRLRLGDRLISGSATMGEVSVVKNPDLVGAVPYTGLIILRPAQPGIDMEYVEAFLRSSLFAQQIDLLKTGATMQHFGPTHLSQVRAPLPSLDEQSRVAAAAREALNHASRCEDLTKRQVELLNERRQALITAAVTGQFDVTTASGRNTTEGVTV